uniref:Uncharacterized protein n=1 Tax=Kalanchoe fedtschenkoi TaxID=63787 RepID=A0A7N0ZWJ8_KALFE
MRSFGLRALLGSSHKRLFVSSISKSKSPVDYLVHSCGLPSATAIAVAQKVDIKDKNLERCGSIITFFRERGFSDTQLQQLVEKRPELLTVRLDGLRRKMQFLRDNRLWGSNLAGLLVLNPVILRRALENHLEPSLELLMKYLGTIERLEVALKRSSWLLTCNLSQTMQPNIDLLISEGVSLKAIQFMMAKKPWAVLQKPESMARAIKDVMELGVRPSSPIFIHAVCVRVSLTEASWTAKFNVFRSLGWADEEIISAFVRDPLCLACSEKKIRAVTDFIVKTMKLNQAIIIAYPKLLMYSIESRYKPRFFVLTKLKSKNLVKDDLKWQWVLTKSEKKFVENYIMKYREEVPDLMKTYTSMRASKLVH